MSVPDVSKASPTLPSPLETNNNNTIENTLQLEHSPAQFEKNILHKPIDDSSLKEEYAEDIEKSSSHPSSPNGRGSLENPNDINDKIEDGENKTSGEASVEEEEDMNLVWWDGPDDPHNPQNFSKSVKVVTLAVISGITFVTPLASSMFTPGVPQLMEEFKSTSVELGSFVVSVYVLGFAIGPLLFAPLSEIYGRLPIYHLCNVGFLAFTVGWNFNPEQPLRSLTVSLDCLCTSDQSQHVDRFQIFGRHFWKCSSSQRYEVRNILIRNSLTKLTFKGGGSIADIFIQEERGVAMALFAMGPVIGPVSMLSSHP